MRIGVLYSRLRVEEKWLFTALGERDIAYDRLQDREISFDLTNASDWHRYDVVIIRSLSTRRGLYAAHSLNSIGVPTINSYAVASICSDKVSTTNVLTRAGLPQPRTHLAFTPEAALEAGEKLGYPYVLKPVMGSWGRLVNRINDRDSAEAVFEHREVLGGAQHHIYYMQEMIEKPGRDIRAFVIGARTPVAIYRHSEHWLTNTARGATASECAITPDLRELCQRAAQAVGGGVVAIDLLEDPERGLLINEINHTMEFHSTVPLTAVDLPDMIIEYALQVAR